MWELRKFQITNDKSETNSNFQNLSFGLPTLRAGPQFQMTKTLWPKFKLNRFEHLDIGIWDLRLLHKITTNAKFPAVKTCLEAA